MKIISSVTAKTFISKTATGPVLFMLLACLLSGSFGCSPEMAKADLPYESPETFSLSGETEVPDRWWLVFEDRTLNMLMDSALADNLPLETAWFRLREAGALVDIASAAKWPQLFLGVQSGISRPEPDFTGGENTQFRLGADYEVDLWGRIRHSVNAEESRFIATYFDYKTVATSLSGEIALSWLRLKATKRQLLLLDEQLETNEKVLALIRARFAGGQVRGVDILRQQQLIENTREQRTVLELQYALLINQLSLLLGQPPAESLEVSPELPELPPLPETGVPLQLVNRRPDILAAFYSLQAADREVAAAISNKYPRLNFSLQTALRSNTFTGLLESQAVSLAGSLLAPLFYGGRLSAEVDRAKAVRMQLLNEYRQSVLIAFQEVEDAMAQEVKLQERIELIKKQLELAEKTFEQLRIEYLHGSIPYLDVLLTLNEQQQLRLDLVQARLELLEARVALYRAMAGGFETEREIELEVDLEEVEELTEE